MPENPEHRGSFMMGVGIGLAIGLPLLCVMTTFFGQRTGEMTVITYVIGGLAAGAWLILRGRI